MNTQLSRYTCLSVVLMMLVVSACGGSSESSGTPEGSGTNNSTSNSTSNNTSGQTTSSNTTANTSNGTTADTSNGTTVTTESELQVANTEARSCEVMLMDTANSLKDVRFADTVEGRSMRRGANLAVSFVKKDNTAFSSGSIALDTAGPTDGIIIASSRCFDALGVVLEAPGVNLQF